MDRTIKITPVEASRLPEVDLTNIPFGKEFCDHMFVADYADGKWGDFRIVPFGKFSLSPANLTLHYGQAIFEGMKASINADGVPLLFRPEEHSRRLNASAVRMGMPEFPKDVFLNALHNLLKVDSDWIPTSEGSALYIRPFMIATDEYIGVNVSNTYRLFIFCAPVGPYYTKPVKLLVAQKFVRAVRGGVGFAKAAGNYGATLMPMKKAKSLGYDQIMWLDQDFRYVQEVGTMNIFFRIGDKVLTPSNEDGTILEGITRDSFMKILQAKGIDVEERHIEIDEICQAYDAGLLTEVFGSGTAAVVAPVKEIKYREKVMTIPEPTEDSVAIMLKNELNGLRNGSVADTYGWTVAVDTEKKVEA